MLYDTFRNTSRRRQADGLFGISLSLKLCSFPWHECSAEQAFQSISKQKVLNRFFFAGKLFDAVERATTDVLQSSSLMTQNVVGHK